MSALPPEVLAAIDRLAEYGVTHAAPDYEHHAALYLHLQGAIEVQFTDPDYEQADELAPRLASGEVTLDRADACAVLRAREGTPPEHLDHARTEDLVAAATAPAGQPCGDCGKLVTYSDARGWQHVDPDSACFLAGGRA